MSASELACLVLEDLSDKVERSCRMLIEENASFEGGLVTASKTYVKAMKVVLEKLAEMGFDPRNVACRDRVVERLIKAREHTVKYESRAQDYVRKRLLNLRRHINWILNKLGAE